MAKSPEDRYQSAGEMLADLEAVAATLSGATRIDLPSQSGSARSRRPRLDDGDSTGGHRGVMDRRGSAARRCSCWCLRFGGRGKGRTMPH